MKLMGIFDIGGHIFTSVFDLNFQSVEGGREPMNHGGRNSATSGEFISNWMEFSPPQDGLGTGLVEAQPATRWRPQSTVARGGRRGRRTRSRAIRCIPKFQLRRWRPAIPKKYKIIELRQLECGVPWRAGECYPRDSCGGHGSRSRFSARLSHCSGIIDQAPVIIYSCDCLQQAKGDRINNIITSVQCNREDK